MEIQTTHRLAYADDTVELWGQLIFYLDDRMIKIGEPFMQRWRYMSPLERELMGIE